MYGSTYIDIYSCTFVNMIKKKYAKSLCLYLCKDIWRNKPTLVCFGQAKRCEVLTAWQPSRGPVQGQSRFGSCRRMCYSCESTTLQPFGFEEITDDFKCQVSNGEHAPDASKFGKCLRVS